MNHNLLSPRRAVRAVADNGSDLEIARPLKHCALADAGIALLILILLLLPRSLSAQPQVRVGQFSPSVNGLHFINSFASVPYFTITVGPINVPIGDAANGMCGGMGFTVRDYYESGLPVPTDTSAPSSGPLFDYLVKRLFDSFDLPGGPLRYMFLMNPALPDHETDLSRAGLAPHGRAWVMIRDEWPVIRADLDAGVLSPLALIRVKTLDPGQLGHNHQVLAYGYTLSGDDLRIYVYDPNYPDRDDVYVALNISNPDATTAVTYWVNGQPSLNLDEVMYCYFRTGYNFDSPPPGAIYVDAFSPSAFPDGTFTYQIFGGPFRTVQEGVQAVTPGGIVMIRSATYPAPITITKALTLRARLGPVTLGRP